MGFAKTAVLLAALTALFLGVGFMLAGTLGALMALAIALALNAWAFWNSDKAVLRWYGARAVGPQSAPELWSMTERMAREAGLPMPALYVIEDAQPNAFATGRDPGNAAVAVTTGLLQRLTREQVAGVVAHELAHIENRDTLTMTVAATVGGAVSMVANMALWAPRQRGVGALLVTLLAALAAPLSAGLIQALISRTREYAADRRGGEICGNPLWLAGALHEIAAGPRPLMERAERNPATAHLFIVTPLTRRGIDSLFATHPDPARRIAALRAQAGVEPEPVAARGGAEARGKRRANPWGIGRRARPWSGTRH